jgi:uncharacterized membrane-anchored protein YitT (DUF2179 family)
VIRTAILIGLGVLFAALGLKGFLLPNGFIDGGVIGISLLTVQLSGLSLPILIIGINIPFIGLGYTQISKGFAARTLVGILALAMAVAAIHFPVITEDKLLISIFGGFFLGMGMGLAIRGGAVLDGTDVLALYASRKTGLPIGDIILGINVLIFSVAAALLKIETALYSILAYIVATKTVDFIVQGIEEYIGVTIMSEKSNEIREVIINSLKRGVTLYKGKRGFGSHGEKNDDIDIVFTVLTRLEVTKLKSEVRHIDELAFVVMHPVSDAKGGMVKRRPLH